jgi:GT2 family glycosyltransferase
MVYPEIVTGNPLNMPYVVRWLLNKPGVLGEAVSFEKSDMLFTYDKDFFDESLGIAHLSIPAADLSIFHNNDNPFDQQRDGACYYAHKYLAAGGQLTEHVEGATSLCQDVSLTPHDIAQILRRSSCLFCYEPTAMITEALLCGCPVVMIPSPYLEENLVRPIESPGVARTPDPKDIQRAQDSVHLFAEQHLTHIQHSWEHIRDFHYKTQQQFLSLSRGDSTFSGDWVEPLMKLINQTAGGDTSVDLGGVNTSSLEMKKWLRLNTLSESKVSLLMQRMIKQWSFQPSFHLISVVNAHELEKLSITLSALQEQLYTGWGLTILSNIDAPDIFNDVPDNIEWLRVSGEINEAVEQAVSASGLDWVMQLLPGDKLFPHALLSFAETVNLQPSKHFIYSDEVTDEAKGEVAFKPDFNLDLLHSSSYVGRACMIRRESFEILGGYTAFAYVYATDLAFIVYETFGAMAFVHIPQVLYYAEPMKHNSKLLLSNEISIRQGHFLRRGLPVSLTHPVGKPRFQVQYLSAESNPPVTIIIAQRNQANALAHCVESLMQVTDYPHFEVILVDADSDTEDMPFLYDELISLAPDRIKVLITQHQNYAAAVNEGIAQAATELVVVLSPFTVTPNANWLRQLVSLSAHPQMGLVGCRVIDDKKSIIHAGTVLGVGNDIYGQFHGSTVAEAGYMERAHVIQQYSSVSSACYLGLKNHLLQVGGLDEGLAQSGFAVVDLSLKLQEQGLKVIWTPFSTVVQDIALAASHNGVTEYDDADSQIILSRWPKPFRDDPMFHPKLSLRTTEFLVDNRIVFDGNTRSKDALRVLVFPLNESGTGRYRCIDPLHELERGGQIEVIWLPTHEFQTEPFLPNAFEVHRMQPDVLFIQQALSDKHFDYFKQLKERTGLPFVFSLDDLLMSLPDQSNRKSLVFRDMRHRLRRTLALCDRLVVTTPTLAEAYADFIDDVVVIPNALETRYWMNTAPRPASTGRKPRVGWAGATQHGGDLAMLKEVVIALADSVDWVFMGMCPDELQTVVKEVHPFVSFTDYPKALAELDLDLAIAPLENNAFNRAKSNLRLLEYGINGWPVIASRVTPYLENNPPVTWVDNSYESWLTAIKAAIADQDNLAAEGNTLKNWVLDNYNLTSTLPLWMKAISF